MEDHIEVGILVIRRKISSPWADESWSPHSALPAAPSLPNGALVAQSPEGVTYYAGSSEIELHRGQTGHYRDNLESGAPSVWVSLRPAPAGASLPFEIATVTVDPYEGESMAEGIGEIVETVSMPDSLQEKLSEFVRLHHVERPFIKRKRDRIGNRESGGPADSRRR